MCKKLLLFLALSILLTSCSKNSKNISTDKLQQIDYKTLKRIKKINIDSLYQLTIIQKDDTVKVNDLIKIFKLSIKNHPIRTDVLEEAYTISKKLNYETGIANTLNVKGVNARYEHDYIKSVKLHKEAIDHYKKSWDLESNIKNLNNLAVSYRRLNIEEEAIKNYLQALKLSENTDYIKSMAVALNGMGNAYITLKRYDEAVKYFKLALKMEKLNRSKRGMGYDYSNLGEAYMYKKEYDTAFYYHNKALEIAKKSNNKNDIAIINSSLGLMFQHKGDIHKALEYYNQSIPTLKKYNSKWLLSFTLINAGKAYQKINDIDKAEAYIKSGLKLSNELESKENIVLGYQALSELFEFKGMPKEALKQYKTMTIYRDSIFNIQSESNIAALEIKYNSEKKDEKIRSLNLENQVQKSRNIIQFLVIGLLLIGIVFFVFYNRLRLKNNSLEMKAMRHKIETYLQQINSLEHNGNENNKKEEITKKAQDYGLSSREIEVLDYISKGMKNQEIADAMFVSLSTVKTHTKNIFEKLDVRNRIEAARKAQAL